MLHMDLFRNFENTQATQICDPAKNEVIVLWLEETKRKKNRQEEKKKMQKKARQ